MSFSRISAANISVLVALVGTGMAPAVQAQYPGYKFRRTSGVDGHHDAVRFGWELFGPDGTVLVAGIDVGVLVDGKLRSITGFFGDLPEA